MEIKELQDIIQQNGVVGAGGAGFPTYMKLTDKANTILMNCAECEPLLKLHSCLLYTSWNLFFRMVWIKVRWWESLPAMSLR